MARSPSRAGAAKARNAKVVAEAGAPGYVLGPSDVPYHRWRTDLVDPVISFVVYGVPAPQGSKAFKGFRNGKPVLKEQSDGLQPWRAAVREMARRATIEWSRRHGRPWEPLDEAVLVSPVVTMAQSQAATRRGDRFHIGVPDLDKLTRGIGDALAPTPLTPSDGAGLPAPARETARTKMMEDRRRHAVLYDDSRISAWERGLKVYPGATPDALGHSGVTIRVWRLADLVEAQAAPVTLVDGRQCMTAADLRSMTQPASGETWPELTKRVLASSDIGADVDHPEPIRIVRGTLDDRAARQLAALLLAHGPTHTVPVQIA